MLRRTLTALAAVAAIGILLAPVDASARRGGGGFHGGGRAVAFHGGGGRIAAFHGGGFRAARVAHFHPGPRVYHRAHFYPRHRFYHRAHFYPRYRFAAVGYPVYTSCWRWRLTPWGYRRIWVC